MRKLFFLGSLASVLLFSCSKDEAVPDFTVNVTGESPNAKIDIINNSSDATSYSWTFGEGASISASTDKSPSSISVDKAGDLTIKLVVGNGSEEREVTKTVNVKGTNGVATFTDVEFGLNADDATYGRLFSFETGKIYKDSEIDADNGSIIHLAFGSLENVMYYFSSPTVEDYNVSGAAATKVMNYETNPSISTEEFDAMVDDNQLSGLTITDEKDSFGNSTIPGTVLFELSTGRKGVVKTRSVNSKRLLVDIKIQKY